MVDTYVLGTYDLSHVGSSPTWGTIFIKKDIIDFVNQNIFVSLYCD